MERRKRRCRNWAIVLKQLHLQMRNFWREVNDNLEALVVGSIAGSVRLEDLKAVEFWDLSDD